MKALELAKRLREYMRENNLTFDEMCDIFSIAMQMEGHKVIVDGLEWEVPTVEDGSVQ